ncbi:MAG: prepilin peptidase [Lactobacillaceae bacterium]|nr:prepilin peptidase [Lactobacillaceae bacterium]
MFNLRVLVFNSWLFAAGSCIGSFFSLLINRWLTQREVVFTPSACDCCQQPLAYYDLCPILGYWQQHGRCRYCNHAISPISLQAELIGGLVCCWLWQIKWFLQPIDYWLLLWLFLMALLDQQTGFVYQGLLNCVVAGSLIILFPYQMSQVIQPLILYLCLWLLQKWQHNLGSADLIWLALLLFSHDFTWLLKIVLLSNLLVVSHALFKQKQQQRIPYLPYLFISYLLVPLL